MKKHLSTTTETKQHLKDVFWQLYSKERIEKITVKEITDLAGYNRSTFYAYYHDVYHVLEDIEEEVLLAFKRIQAPVSSLILSQQNLSDHLLELQQFYEANVKYLSVFLSSDGNPQFIHKVKETMKKDMLIRLMGNEQKNQVAVEYLLEYIISAHIGLLSYWFNRDNDQSFEEIIHLISKVSSKGPFTILTELLH